MFVSFFAIFPIVFPIVLVLFSVRIALSICLYLISPKIGDALSGRGRNSSLLDDLLIFRWMGSLMDILFKPRKQPVYHYLVDCGGDPLEVKQAGEFVAGAIHPGHDITIFGSKMLGTMRAKVGKNHTTGAILLPRPNRWVLAFFGVCVVLALELMLFLPIGLAGMTL